MNRSLTNTEKRKKLRELLDIFGFDALLKAASLTRERSPSTLRKWLYESNYNIPNEGYQSTVQNLKKIGDENP